jgi:hypothetical protein
MDEARKHRVGWIGGVASSTAVLLLAGCGTTAASSVTPPDTSTSASAAYTPATAGTASPTPAGPGQPAPPASAACPIAGTTAEPSTSCAAKLRNGARLPVLLRTPNSKPGYVTSFRITGVSGPSASVDGQSTTQVGDTRFVLTAIRTGTTRITATCPGPINAPSITLTLTVDVSN